MNRGLLKYVGLRLGFAVLTLSLVAFIVFGATMLLPGNVAYAILGKNSTPEQLRALELQLHLNRPFGSQFWSWVSGISHGDLGRSLAAGEPVTTLIGGRLSNSAILFMVAALVSVPLSIAIGTILALKRGSVWDSLGNTLTLVLAAIPEFVIAVGLIVLFASVVWRILPPVSLVAPGQLVWRSPTKLILPVATLTLAVAPYMIRMVRSSVTEVLASDYVEMARLKGLPQRRLIRRHVLPNSLGPSIQVVTAQLAWMAGGAVLVEYVFGFPGIGQALVSAVTARDVPVVQAIALILATFYVLTNLFADLLVVSLTPRLRTRLR